MRRLLCDRSNWQRWTMSIAALLASQLMIAAAVQGADDMKHVAERSRTMLPQTVDLERRVATAFQLKSVSELQKLYTELSDGSASAEDFQKHGGNACGCDVAHTNLLMIVGFAVNKLDGEGRYQDWMNDEMLNMLGQYRSYLNACAIDGAQREPETRLTADHIKAL